MIWFCAQSQNKIMQLEILFSRHWTVKIVLENKVLCTFVKWSPRTTLWSVGRTPATTSDSRFNEANQTCDYQGCNLLVALWTVCSFFRSHNCFVRTEQPQREHKATSVVARISLNNVVNYKMGRFSDKVWFLKPHSTRLIITIKHESLFLIRISFILIVRQNLVGNLPCIHVFSLCTKYLVHKHWL